MRFVFWHHDVHGPISLEDLWSGQHQYGGSVARLRLLFWLAELGHDVRLTGNVRSGSFRGVSAYAGPESVQQAVLNDTKEPSILVLNDAPADSQWDSVKHLPNVARIYWAGVQFPFKWLDRVRDQSLRRIVCVSRYHRDLYRVYPGFNHVEYTYSGVDLDVIDQVRPSIFAQPTVLSVSVPRHTKGFHNTLEAWKYVHRAMPNARLRVCGAAAMHDPNAKVGRTGVLEAEMEAAFPEFFSNPRATCQQFGIDLMGARSLEAVYSDLKAADVVVVNTNWVGSFETYCRSAVEAQVAGIPVVGAKRGALPEVVQDGVTGLLVDQPNAVSLGQAVVKLLRDRELRQRMGNAARDWARPMAHYSLLAQEWEAIARRASSGERAPVEHFQPNDVLRGLGYGQARLWAKRQYRQLSKGGRDT